MCDNTATAFRPKGYDYVEYSLRCGSTGFYGDPIYCETCEEEHAKRGRMPYECSHGKDMRPEGAVCGACEFGE